MVLHKIVVCRHYDRCPVRILVQEHEGNFYHRRGGQSPMGQKGIRHARDNPVEPGQDGDTDRQPP